jgi:hypothetical protein
MVTKPLKNCNTRRDITSMKNGTHKPSKGPHKALSFVNHKTISKTPVCTYWGFTVYTEVYKTGIDKHNKIFYI